MRSLSLVIFSLACQTVLGHGDHGDQAQKPMVDENASWMTKHMAGKFFYLICILHIIFHMGGIS